MAAILSVTMFTVVYSSWCCAINRVPHAGLLSHVHPEVALNKSPVIAHTKVTSKHSFNLSTLSRAMESTSGQIIMMRI